MSPGTADGDASAPSRYRDIPDSFDVYVKRRQQRPDRRELWRFRFRGGGSSNARWPCGDQFRAQLEPSAGRFRVGSGNRNADNGARQLNYLHNHGDRIPRGGIHRRNRYASGRADADKRDARADRRTRAGRQLAGKRRRARAALCAWLM